MIRSGKKILVGFMQRWRVLKYLEGLIYAVGCAFFIWLLFHSWPVTILVFVLAGGIRLAMIKPWKTNLDMVVSLLDRQIPAVEFSTGLFLADDDHASLVARLQKQRVEKALITRAKRVLPQRPLLQALSGMLLLIAAAFVADHYHLTEALLVPRPLKQQSISFQPADSGRAAPATVPHVLQQTATVRYPSYTHKRAFTTQDMNINAVEGSQINWSIKFDGQVKAVTLESSGKQYPMQNGKKGYFCTLKLRASAFYNFRYIDADSNVFISDLYQLKMEQDHGPTIKIEGIKQYNSFLFDQPKAFNFKTSVSDDFGVSEAYIVATVSKGSGESVKFREEKLPFDQVVKPNSRSLRLSKKLDLDSMQMGPGDELYFYIEAIDSRAPRPNISRSETFFARIQDTTTYEFTMEESLGVDLMPEYFRSQRQLIIDTEKLIKGRSSLSKKAFNSTSNRLGFDQKTLRLKYGQFMGEEAESGIAVHEEGAERAVEGEEQPDPLSGYRHDHDADNEHHTEQSPLEEDKEKANPLHYTHSHDDPEEATLFTASLKSMLRQAMNEMWDAELYLRLFQPERSLPYQYRALKLINEIKNQARIYVHRIGFDPPPVKEDNRLTGDLKDIHDFTENDAAASPEGYSAMKRCIFRIEQLLAHHVLKPSDKLLFKQAGDELAAIAIEHPGRYLETLQTLKRLSEAEVDSAGTEMLKKVQMQLGQALPRPVDEPAKRKTSQDALTELFMEAVGKEVHD